MVKKFKLKKKYPKEIWNPLVRAIKFDGTQKSCDEIMDLIGVEHCILNNEDGKPWFLISIWVKNKKDGFEDLIRVNVDCWVLISANDDELLPEVWYDDLFQKVYRG